MKKTIYVRLASFDMPLGIGQICAQLLLVGINLFLNHIGLYLGKEASIFHLLWVVLISYLGWYCSSDLHMSWLKISISKATFILGLISNLPLVL